MTEIKDSPARLAADRPGPTRGRLAWYWITTVLVAATLALTALEDLGRVQAVRTDMANLDLPLYLLAIIGIWKLLGAVALLVPGRALLKEWAYAGTFFLFSGGLAASLIKNTMYDDIVLLIILIPLTIASWLLRPASRRLSRADERNALAPRTEPA
jgi:uncharacterized membrane protein